MRKHFTEIYISKFLMLLSSDLTGSTGSEAGEEENERNQREEEEEEEEEDKGPAPHLLLQLTLGKELAKSNRWELLTYISIRRYKYRPSWRFATSFETCTFSLIWSIPGFYCLAPNFDN